MTSDSATKDVRELYDSSADWYSKTMDAEIDLPVYHEILSKLARDIAEIPGPVIDTSCGSGHMLARYHERYDPGRELIGVDLSPGMVTLTSARLGAAGRVLVGDMRDLSEAQTGSAAAVLSFYALHHLAADEVEPALVEWRRVLAPGGRLIMATWEGDGLVDYGEHSDLEAYRYRLDQVRAWAESAGFDIERCVVEPVDGMGMDGVYLDAWSPGTKPEPQPS